MRLDTPNSMGETRRTTLEFTRKSMPSAPASLFEELTPIELLPGTDHLVRVFNELHGTRTADLNGAAAISFQEIKAYDVLTGECLTPWEVRTIRAMDRALLDEAAAMRREKAG